MQEGGWLRQTTSTDKTKKQRRYKLHCEYYTGQKYESGMIIEIPWQIDYIKILNEAKTDFDIFG